jgi:DNA polymerase type B, organellar and viral
MDNKMEIDAQRQGLSTLRNIAKLLMNSMYGRFGMHTEAVKHALLDSKELVNISKHFQILDEIPLGDYT